MLLTKLTSVLTIAIATSLTLSACAGLDADYQTSNAEARAAINQVREEPLPQGYNFGDMSEGSYTWYLGSVTANADYSMQIKKKSTGSVADECKAIIEYFESIGINSTDANNPGDATASSPHAQVKCVATLGYTPTNRGGGTVGTSQVTFFGSVEVEGKATKLIGSFSRIGQTPSSESSEWEYLATVETHVDYRGDLNAIDVLEEAAAPDPVWQGFTDALNRIGEYRKLHPKADPYSLASIEAALKGFGEKYPSLRATYDTSVSKITRIQVERADKSSVGLCPVSISIKRFDPVFFGVADPGTGYTVAYVDDAKLDDQFGQAIALYDNC